MHEVPLGPAIAVLVVVALIAALFLLMVFHGPTDPPDRWDDSDDPIRRLS